MENVIPGIYATISDYNKINLSTTPTLTQNAVVYFCDLPDFVYVPDEESSDINAVKKVRLVPNKLIPVTNQKDILGLLSGTNIVDGILTQAQKDELKCKEITNILKTLGSQIELGEVALVKIVKKDGNRPDMKNIYEVQQALENAYEKLESFKCSQIVIVGLPAELDFEKVKPDSSKFELDFINDPAILKQETINNYIYEFSPAGSHNDIKVELCLEQPEETFVHTPEGEPTLESTIIKEYGIDSEEASYLLTGNVKVNGKIVKEGIQLKYEDEKLITVEEVLVPVIQGECTIQLVEGTVFKTLVTEDLSGKLVVRCSDGVPMMNVYESTETRIVRSKLSNKTPLVGEEVTVTLEFNNPITIDDIEFSSTNIVNNEPTISEDGKVYTSKVKSESEQGEQEFSFNLNGKTPITLSLNISSGRKLSRSGEVVVEYPGETLISTQNQSFVINITKENSPWIQAINKNNKVETDLITVLEGVVEGVEKYNPKKSGSFDIKFKKDNEVISAVISGTQGEVEVELKTEQSPKGVIVSENKEIKLNEMTLVLKKGLVVFNSIKPLVRNKYFSRTDIQLNPVYTINYLKQNTEPVMESLKFVRQLVKTLSETLIVWGTTPCQSDDPEKIQEHVQNLVNLPKFKNGFKIRMNSGTDIDLGKFLTVVYGTPKLNGVGGITGDISTRVIDYERENGGTGEIKNKTNKIFVSDYSNFDVNSDVELRTYCGVTEVKKRFVIVDKKEVLGQNMIVLNSEVDTGEFPLDSFEVFLTNLDNVDTNGSYAASIFASSSNEEKDKAPVQKDLTERCDTTLPYSVKEILIKNKFTVIDNDPSTGLGIIVSSPVMTRTDSDYQDRIDIGTVFYFLQKLRNVANSKKNKRFPNKEDKILFEDELKEVFVQEMNKTDSLITGYNFSANFEKLDSYGHVYGTFKIQPSKKLQVVEFNGGIAKIQD